MFIQTRLYVPDQSQRQEELSKNLHQACTKLIVDYMLHVISTVNMILWYLCEGICPCFSFWQYFLGQKTSHIYGNIKCLLFTWKWSNWL